MKKKYRLIGVIIVKPFYQMKKFKKESVKDAKALFKENIYVSGY
jgi:hypothetical protein